MTSGSLRLRLFLAAVGLIVLALFLTGLAIVGLFERQVRDRVLTDLDNNLLQLAGSIDVAADGKVTAGKSLADPRFREPYGGRYWRIDFIPSATATARESMRSRSLWDADIDLTTMTGPEGEGLVVARREITVDGGGKPMSLWLTVAAHDEEIERPIDQLRDQLALGLTLIGLLLAGATWVQVTVGLNPLVALRRQLAAVRAGQSSRLEGSFPSEVAPLVGELNEVLEIRDRSLDRARRRAGDLAHGLKTPLTVLSAVSRDLRRRKINALANEVEEQAENMRVHVERALVRARLSSGRGHAATSLLLPVTQKIVAALKRAPRGRDIAWSIDIMADASVPIEAADLAELLGNLLDNARKWAKTKTRIGYDGGVLMVEDDGPGVPQAELGQISERGRRLDESKQGSGLGLSIVADIADIYGLAIDYGPSPLGGLRVSVRL